MAFDLEEARPMARMNVDYARCTAPLTCKKCLDLCPQMVFTLLTIKHVKYVKNDINEPNAYIVRPVHLDRCTGCNVCAGACPKEAITVSFAEEGVQ